MARYTITFRGVPVGTAESSMIPLPRIGGIGFYGTDLDGDDMRPDGESVIADVIPLPGYAAIRPVVSVASRALADVGLVGAAAWSSPRTEEGLRRGAELGRALELRDASGALVPTDFIELMQWPGNPEIVAIIRFRDALDAGPTVQLPSTT